MDVGNLQPRTFTFGSCLISKLPVEQEPQRPLSWDGELLALLTPPPKLHDVKTYVLRTPEGTLLGDEEDLIKANQRARALSEKSHSKVVVYKREGEKEIAMSFSGPGGWTGSMRRESVRKAKEEK